MKTITKNIGILLIGMLFCTLSANATQYCHEALTNGANTVYLTCQKLGTDAYQIVIEGTGLTGLGGSYMNVNGTGGYYLNGDHCTVSADGDSIVCNITSTTEPSFYTPLYVLMPGEINFGQPDITWGTCSGNSDKTAPVMGTAAVDTTTYNSAEISVIAIDETTTTVTRFAVVDGIDSTAYTATGGVVTVTNLSSNTNYSLKIYAIDDAGNVSDNFATVTFTTTNRNSECSGSRGHFANKIPKINFTIDYSNNRINYQITPVDSSHIFDFAEVQTTSGSYTMAIATDSLSATYSQTGLTPGDTIGIRFLYSFNDMPGNEMTSENLTLNDPNIIFYIVGECGSGVITPTEPAQAAPTPTINASQVISIYSDAYTSISGTNFYPDWGQSTVASEIQIDGNNTMKYATLNYQGLELASDNHVNASSMTYLHIDIWSADETSLQITPISSDPTAEHLVNVGTITPNQWNSYDILLSSFTGVDMSNIFQFKIVGSGSATVYMDNLYFYKETSSGTKQVDNNVNLAIYPNPMNDMMNIRSDRNIKKITIYDLTGEVIINQNINANEATIDVKHLTSGYYIIKTTLTNGETNIQKIIKQ